MSEVKQIRLNVSSESKEAMSAIRKRYGIPEMHAASRLFTWFAEQDDVVQLSILGYLGDLGPDVARAYLEDLAKKSKR